MTALTISPWSILPHQITEAAVMRIRAWFDNNEYWLRWVRWFVLPLLTVVGAIWVTGQNLYNKVDQIPQLVSQVEQLSKNIKELGDGLRGDLKRAEQRQGAELLIHANEERASRDAFTNSLKGVQAELISVKAQIDGKIDAKDVRRIISKVEEVTASEAPSLTGVVSVSGKPQIASAIYAAILKDPGTSDVSAFYAMKDPGKYGVAKSLKALMFAKGSIWEATSTGLKVNFLGGEATFAAKPTASKTDLVRQAELFNSLSHTVQAAGGEVIKPAPTKKPGVIQRPSTLHPLAPDSRAPDIKLDALRK